MWNVLKIVFNVFRQISDFLDIKWAPRNVPMSRRLQTLAAGAWIFLTLFGEFIFLFLFIKLIYSSYWWLGLVYGFWMVNDIEICHNGGRRMEWYRNSAWWRYYCAYFPIKLVKTTDLDPNRNYLFACFPHGVLASGAFASFGTNALDFHKKFPGLKSYLITLTGHFYVPFFRDIVLALGVCSSSNHSLMHLLDLKKYKGNCVALIVGGAAEALDARPGQYKIQLMRRKGFIKIAMKSGAPLVPVFSFGETDVFRPPNNPKDSPLRRFQEKFKAITGISPIFPLGRGIFQYSYGILPLRKPVTTIVGAPIEVQRNLDPTDEEVNALHAEFTDKLKELFEKEKHNYLKDPEKAVLIIS